MGDDAEARVAEAIAGWSGALAEGWRGGDGVDVDEAVGMGIAIWRAEAAECVLGDGGVSAVGMTVSPDVAGIMYCKLGKTADWIDPSCNCGVPSRKSSAPEEAEGSVALNDVDTDPCCTEESVEREPAPEAPKVGWAARMPRPTA